MLMIMMSQFINIDMGNFSENFKFMNRHKRADFTNEPTLVYYKEVLVKLIEKKFGVLPDKNDVDIEPLEKS